MSVLKKIKWWMWLLFPIALVVLVVLFFRRGGGLGEMLSLPSAKTPPGPSAPPAITEAEAEEKREEIKEEAEAEREEITLEQDEIGQKADELRDLLK